MGNDSGVKAKHKQRTTPHQKHAVFPGMRTPTNANIVSGSVKPIRVEIPKKVIDLRGLVQPRD